MSAIYGFITHTPPYSDIDSSIKSLKYWNKDYGRDAADYLTFTHDAHTICLGSVTNHLNLNIPSSPSIINTDSYYAVIDALLYNREELGLLLSLDNPDLLSDGELLVRWITEHGFESLKKVSGDFAGAFYSKKEHSFTLFRDHTGVRPLFYYMDDHFFAFSTDIRGLTAIPATDTTPDEEILFEKIVGYNELTLDRTDYKNIRCIIPAHYSIVTSTDTGFRSNHKQYWQLGSNKVRMKQDEDYAKEMCRLITESIENRAKVISGVVGAELSGGLDSSIISIILNRTGHDSCYYCWSYDPSVLPLKKLDERKVVFDICEQENITCHFRQLNKEYNIHDFTYGIEHFDVPYVNTFMVLEGASWLAEHGAKVVLCGYGGDEGVSHRPKLYELWYHHEYLAYMRALYRTTQGCSFRFLRTLKRAIVSTRETRDYYNKPFDTKKPARAYLNAAFEKSCEEKYPAKILQFHFDPIRYILSGGPRIRMDLSAFLGPEAGVQYMFPYMDYKVLDFAVSIPRRLYHDGVTDRLIYRHAFRHMMPDSLYEVNYKHMASLVNPEKKTNAPEHQPDYAMLTNNLKNLKNQLLSFLDRDYWLPYLDFEKISTIGETTLNSMKDFDIQMDILNDITYCAYLQNVGMNIKEFTRDL